MTLPTGLLSIPNDTPHTRGAITFCRALTDRREADARVSSVPERVFTDHAALVIRSAFRSSDTRAIVFRSGGVEVVTR